MLERVYDDVPALAHPLAERQIAAHLDHLEAAGRLER
jgi:cysteine sulfinate desulfinase/cysteine desulfurase-like protein